MRPARLPERDLLILVGLTGVGKTTTVQALREAGIAFGLLPNRRELTDAYIISWLQERDGIPRVPVLDRAERFALTRRYRALHPEGMAHVLTRVDVAPDLGSGWLVFDGLRGRGEVTAAADLLPRARFLALTAPADVRLARLLGRGDAFDQVGAAPATTAGARASEVLHGLMDAAAQDRFQAWLDAGEVSADDLVAKAKILRKEQENYSQEESLAALDEVESSRVLVARTDRHTPREIAERVVAALS